MGNEYLMPLRKILVLVLSIVMIAAGATVLLPPARKAAAAPISDMGDCEFRTSSTTSVSYNVSRQLCFLDLTGIDPNVTGSQSVTKRVGAYTLKFTWNTIRARATGDPVYLESRATYSTRAAFGNVNKDGAMFPGGSGRPIVHQKGSPWTVADDSFVRFQISNISITNTQTGEPVNNYAFNVIDAEETSIGEGISIDNGDSSYASLPVKYLTPPENGQACSIRAAAGNEVTGRSVLEPRPALDRDFVCENDRTNPGSFIATLNNPKQFTVTTWTDTEQAFALSLTLGRAGGELKGDTLALNGGTSGPSAYEQLVYGAETGFDLKVWNTVSTESSPFVYIPRTAADKSIGPQDGSTVGYFRVPSVAADGSPTGAGTLYYQSTGDNVPGGNRSLVFLRYTPKWTCSVSVGQKDQKVVDLPPANPTSTFKAVSDITGSAVTFLTRNDTAKGTSTVEVTNPDNLPISCRVNWVSNYKASTLDVTKLVSGTASGFPEVQNRSYVLNYSCTLAGYSKAYPSVPLSGSIPIERNASERMVSLPQGASCTFSESFPPMADPNNPGSTTTQPALPGKTLTLTWGDNATGTGTYDSFDGSNTLPNSSVKLGAQTKVSATNRFDYRGGTVDFSKTITGEPVRELANTTRTYNFAWGCKDTDRSGTFSMTVTYAEDGTASGTGPTLTDVPVARDCWVRATSNLTDKESARVESLPRTMTTSGDAADASAAQAAESDPNTYHFRLKDYKEPSGENSNLITSPNASRMSVHLVHPYRYKTEELRVQKTLTGTGAEGARREIGLAATPFTVNYRCTYGIDRVKEGTVHIGLDPTQPGVVPSVPLGASCSVWETTASAPKGTNVQFVERDSSGKPVTTVESADPNDTTTKLDNAAAQSTPVHTMHEASNDNSNLIKITNRYDQRLGTVSLTKLVDRGGIVGTLPTTYDFSFTCGVRTVQNADGSYVGVPIAGTVTAREGASLALRATEGDAASLQLLNDGDNGELRVPFGNDCEITERTPAKLPPGVSLVSDRSVVEAVDAASNSVTVTNTFAAAGAGLTLDQQFLGNSKLAPATGANYQLTCENGFTQAITLTPTTPRTTISATSTPSGTACRLVETARDTGVRTINGVTFPIDRTSSALLPADGSHPGIDVSLPETNGAPQTIDVSFTVGDSSVLTLSHDYRYEFAPVSAEKVVAFDAATQQWISETRKQTKRDRSFTLTLTCVRPTGEVSASEITLSASETSLAGELASLGDEAVGSSCTAAELASTTAAGVKLTTEASYNGSPDADPATPSQAVAFTVGASNTITLTNTYSRDLINVELNKIARFPHNVDSSIRSLYGAALNEYLHDHTFTLDCRDPEAANAPLGSPLTGAIKGEGSYSFTGVPSGLNCHISGDGFTQLDLTDSTSGRALESHFTTSKVEWIVDDNAATEHVDTNLGDGITDSPYWLVPSNDSATHQIDVVNNYEFVMQDVVRSKQVIATQAGLNLLDQTQPTFSFTFRCSGVGYGDWAGINDPSIPNPLSYRSFTDAPVTTGTPASGEPERFVRTYTSPSVQVPAGALCEGTELDPTGTPPELQHTAKWLDVAGNQHDGTTMRARIADGYGHGTNNLTFINEYTRRMVPVQLSMLHAGFWADADARGYTLRVTCTDPSATTAETTVPLTSAIVDSSVAQASAPQRGTLVSLPAGADCSLSVADSSALAPRSDLEMLRGSRTPFVSFGLWTGEGTAYPPNGAEASNPRLAPAENLPYSSSVTDAMKDYTFAFSVPANANVGAGRTAALTVAAEAVHPQAYADITLTKNVAGDIGKNGEFRFESSCLHEGSVTIRPGGSFTLPRVPVTNRCTLTETDDGVAGSEAQLSVTSHGELIRFDAARDLENAPSALAGQAGEHSVTFEVRPVTDPADPDTSGSRWAMDLLNTFPAIDIEKTIAGPTTLVPPDNAVLDQNATSFEVTYAIRNNGGVEASKLTLSDPSLAGRTLTRGNQSYTVPSDGTIDPGFCGFDAAGTIAPDATLSCTFTASIAEPVPQYLEIDGGPVTVTAATASGTVSDQDSFSAVRPIVGFLPMTGMQTLVLILLFGLAVVAYGLWRKRRSSRDESREVAPMNELVHG